MTTMNNEVLLLLGGVIIATLILVPLFRAKIRKLKDVHLHEVEGIKEQAEKTLGILEQSVEEERMAFRTEAENARVHFQEEANRVSREMGKKLDEAQQQMSRFENLAAIASDEAEARAILSAAIREAEALRQAAASLIEESRQKSAAERSVAIEKARQIRLQAEAMLARATLRENEIVAEAHQKAEQIGGDAYRALREKQHLDEALVAVRNVIDGYGDRYVRPTRSLLDDLAADFGHTEAGAALATARERTRAMIDQGLAAVCDYAERKRRDTAVRFVIDAFNGRVDAIQSRVKHDNYGVLEQEIHDAFNLVNLNGEAFRNARITEAYRESRLAELKWAVVAQELKLKEREEQRQIREQIREEEKVRKEYERAIKQAQKEEALIKQALEKARLEAEAATDEKRERLERQISELAAKLTEAEARNQRALSMAQQTRKGNVYIISNIGSFGEEVFKIGMTRRLEPLDRVKELGDASVPFEFDVHAMIPSEDAPSLENELHSVFDELRLNHVNRRKEFFRVPLERIREFVRERKIEATFTMLAEARQYRESKALAGMTQEEREKFRLSGNGFNGSIASSEPVDTED
jgi:DNA repair exonuclease SbcCD ATPase subunit